MKTELVQNWETTNYNAVQKIEHIATQFCGYNDLPYIYPGLFFFSETRWWNSLPYPLQ